MTALVTQPKKFLSIEGKYVLTEEGVDYCTRRRIPIRELRMYGGTTTAGFVWSSVDAAMVEGFVTHGLLAGIELERAEFLNKRTEILGLTELLFDGILMKRFRPTLRRKLREDPVYQKLVSSSPVPLRLREALASRQPAVVRAQDELAAHVAGNLPDLSEAKVRRLLALVDDSVWFLLTEPGASLAAFRQRVFEAVTVYARRMELSESLALNLMEFLQQAERAHFQNLAERDPFTRKNPQAIPELLGDPEFRDRLIAKARLQRELLVISMSFPGHPQGTLAGLATEISVRNRGVAGLVARSASLGKAARPGATRMTDFMDQALSANLGDLGLLNLNTLKDLCRRQGITVETSLARDDRTNETVSTMRLIL